MLLIALPKSASTSFAITISQICNLKVRLGIPKTEIDIDCQGYKEIQKYHNNMIERSPLFLQQIITGNLTLFKEHLLPTDRHLRILEKFRKFKIVILLRDIEDAIDAYIRAGIQDYNKKELKKNIMDFHNRYMYWSSNKPNVTLVYYRDLILNYQQTMNRILKWYKLKGKIIPLKKLKYTGEGEKKLKEALCY